MVGVADVHVFDKANTEAVFPRELDQVENLVVVDTLLDDGVDLDRRETGGFGRGEAFEHRCEIAALGDGAEAFGLKRVDADVDAPQACPAQCVHLIGEQRAVGREAEVVHPSDG